MVDSFEKLNVYFYGIESTKIRTLSAALKELGGVPSSILGKQVTHLITWYATLNLQRYCWLLCSDEKLKEEGYQIAQAEKLGIPIVTLSWLELSIESRKVLPLDLYHLSEPGRTFLFIIILVIIFLFVTLPHSSSNLAEQKRIYKPPRLQRSAFASRQVALVVALILLAETPSAHPLRQMRHSAQRRTEQPEGSIS
jgi:hypothetical protein